MEYTHIHVNLHVYIIMLPENSLYIKTMQKHIYGIIGSNGF